MGWTAADRVRPTHRSSHRDEEAQLAQGRGLLAQADTRCRNLPRGHSSRIPRSAVQKGPAGIPAKAFQDASSRIGFPNTTRWGDCTSVPKTNNQRSRLAIVYTSRFCANSHGERTTNGLLDLCVSIAAPAAGCTTAFRLLTSSMTRGGLVKKLLRTILINYCQLLVNKF
jgi:hypothetical protein